MDATTAVREPLAERSVGLTRHKSVAMFYLIACGISWTVWLPLVLGQGGLHILRISPPLPVIVSLGTLGPFIACYATHRFQSGNWRAVRLLPRPNSRLAWLLLGPMLVIFCIFVVFPALISKGSPTAWHWHIRAFAGLAGSMFSYNLFGGPLFEEFGWRGFLQVQLQRSLPPWIAALSVGMMWALWHLPIFLVAGWSSASVPVFILIMSGLSLVIAFAFNASGQSVVTAILMHSAFNASPRCLGEFLGNVPTREHPSGELLIAVSFLLAGICLAFLTRGKLAAD